MSSNLTPSRPGLTERRSQSIRIRRLPSASRVPLSTVAEGNRNEQYNAAGESSRRRRSSSVSQRTEADHDELSQVNSEGPRISGMESVREEQQTPGGTALSPIEESRVETGRLRATTNPEQRLPRARSSRRRRLDRADTNINEYDSKIIDFLDVVDPEVSTLSTLTNVQNSLFVPDLGRILNRMPTYELSRRPTRAVGEKKPDKTADVSVGPPKSPVDPETAEFDDAARIALSPTQTGKASITSTLSDSRFAVLPHGASLEGWSEEDKEILDDHVRHLLHSRREKFKRSMKGFGQYIRKPLGFFVTVYAFLITGFGLIWVLFLIGWISGGDKHSYDVNVIDNVLVALFAVIGDGLAPFRAVDTYHMIFIAHYHHLTWKLRRKKALPKLPDENDLPLPAIPMVDIESGIIPETELSVLTPKQQEKLEHHQRKFSKSHTYYKPHETATHFAFPISYLIGITVLLDLHSCFQIALGTCTWAISYHVRPQALTAVILSCSIACNTTAGVLISVADRKTRKKEVLERIFRQALTEEAMVKMKGEVQKPGAREVH